MDVDALGKGKRRRWAPLDHAAGEHIVYRDGLGALYAEKLSVLEEKAAAAAAAGGAGGARERGASRSRGRAISEERDEDRDRDRDRQRSKSRGRSSSKARGGAGRSSSRPYYSDEDQDGSDGEGRYYRDGDRGRDRERSKSRGRDRRDRGGYRDRSRSRSYSPARETGSSRKRDRDRDRDGGGRGGGGGGAASVSTSYLKKLEKQLEGAKREASELRKAVEKGRKKAEGVSAGTEHQVGERAREKRKGKERQYVAFLHQRRGERRALPLETHSKQSAYITSLLHPSIPSSSLLASPLQAPLPSSLLPADLQLARSSAFTIEARDGQPAIEVHVVREKESMVLEQLPPTEERPPGYGSPTLAAAAFDMPQFISGFVKLVPHAIKDEESTVNCTQVFAVLKCQPKALQLQLAGNNYLLSPGDHFFVPEMTKYGLTNHSRDTAAEVAFTVIKPK